MVALSYLSPYKPGTPSSGVVRLFIRKVKFGTAFVVHIGVGTADVWAETSDDVGSSDPNIGTSDID